jgi:hypothetical protein
MVCGEGLGEIRHLVRGNEVQTSCRLLRGHLSTHPDLDCGSSSSYY